MGCHRAKKKQQNKNNDKATKANQKQNHTQTKNKQPHKTTKAGDQHVSSATSVTRRWVIALYHPWYWYGKETKAKNSTHTTMPYQESASEKATKAQCGNQGSPQPGAPRSQSASRTGNSLTDWMQSKSSQQ